MLVSESQKVGIAAGKILLGRNCLKRDSSVALFSSDAGLRSSALCHPCRSAQFCAVGHGGLARPEWPTGNAWVVFDDNKV